MTKHDDGVRIYPAQGRHPATISAYRLVEASSDLKHLRKLGWAAVNTSQSGD